MRVQELTMSQVFSEAELAAEQWRENPRFPGTFVSDLGRIRKPDKRTPGKVIVTTGTKRPSGHMSTNLFVGFNRSAKPCWIHSLVLEAFVGPRPEGLVTRHFPDRDPSNNRLSNLSWATYQRNSLDKNEHGTMPRGESHFRSKLTDASVVLARWLRNEHGAGIDSLGEWFDIHPATISRAISGDTWGHVSYGLPTAKAAT
jgi:hypothetical protein